MKGGKSTKRVPVEEFIKSLLNKHGDRITIKNIQDFKNMRTKILFEVKGVGDFFQAPYLVLRDWGFIDCVNCKKNVFNRQGSQFCSRSCASKWYMKNSEAVQKTIENLTHNQNIDKIEKICKICKKTYSVIRSRDKKSKFCSASCKSLFIWNQNKDIMISRSAETCRRGTKTGIARSLKYLETMGNKDFRPYKVFVDRKSRKLYFRSTYEIIFVQQYLDAKELNWVYEPKKFSTSEGIYMPDFYLPDENIWYEVKGHFFRGAREKIEAFKKEYPNIKISVLTREVLIEQFGVDLSNAMIKKIKNGRDQKYQPGIGGTRAISTV